jgi:sulfur carrier protein
MAYNGLMDVQVNGESRTIAAGCSVRQLLDVYEMSPVRVAVEVNGELVPRISFDEFELRPGDCVEIVTLVGGG